MEKCEYLENHYRSSDFEQIFEPHGGIIVFYAKGKNFNFRHFRWPFWILAENEKVSIPQTVIDRAISSEFCFAGQYRSILCQEEKFPFSPLLAAILDFNAPPPPWLCQ